MEITLDCASNQVCKQMRLYFPIRQKMPQHSQSQNNIVSRPSCRLNLNKKADYYITSDYESDIVLLGPRVRAY